MNKISGNKAKSLVQKGAIVIDVRSPISFRNGTIPTAVNMSLKQLPLVQKHPKSTPIIIFGDQSDMQTLSLALTYVELYGFTKVYNLGTMENWFS
jgi:rhodanese-related sulfurtransferase